MKARDEVRDETREAFRYVGYGLLALGFLGNAALMLGIGRGGGPWFLATIFLALGIAMAFPRSKVGHLIVGHFDALLDRMAGPDTPPGPPQDRIDSEMGD